MRSPRLSVLGLALALGLTGSACTHSSRSTMTVQTNSAVVASVARHRSYAHEEGRFAPQGYHPASFDDATLGRVRSRIDAEMQRRGYVLAATPEAGELVVRLSTGVRSTTDTPTGAMAAEGAPVEHDAHGILVLEIFDRAASAQLFHGFARDELRGPSMSEAKIAEAIVKVLAPLPRAGNAP